MQDFPAFVHGFGGSKKLLDPMKWRAGPDTHQGRTGQMIPEGTAEA
jgi:hypothetical protein